MPPNIKDVGSIDTLSSIPSSNIPYSNATDDETIVELLLQLGGTVDADGVPTIQWKTAQAKLRQSGILEEDSRVKDFCREMKKLSQTNDDISYTHFRRIALINVSFLKQIAENDLVISDFARFSDELQYLLDSVKSKTQGENAQYIPALADANPDQLGLAFCSIHGQFFETGDSRAPFTIQSTSKPTMMAIAIEQLGKEKLSEWVGVAPSGRAFNDATLLPDGRPFNPMVNAGALMTCAVVASAHPALCGYADFPIGDQKERSKELLEEILMPVWKALSGDGIVGDVGFDELAFLGERSTNDTNFALAYLMRRKTGLPKPVTLETMLDFYFRSCSIEMTAAAMSVVAATLANGGLNPVSGKQVLSSETVRQVLSSLVMSGMYDAAGEFFVKIGAPAKSGVSGCVMVVIPRIGGYCVFSPRLDQYGHSVRGVAFAEALTSTFNFHAFDAVGTHCSKLDPRRTSDQSQEKAIHRLRWAIKVGDKRALKFAKLLKWVSIYVSRANPDDDDAYHAIQNAYYSVTRSHVEHEELALLAETVGGLIVEDHGQTMDLDKMDDLMALIKSNAADLDDIQKDFILEIAMAVAHTSKDEYNQTEPPLIRRICVALNIPTSMLPLKWKELPQVNTSRRFFLTNLAVDI